MNRRGFTIVELLVAVTIVIILVTLVISNAGFNKDRAYFSRANAEFATMANAIKLYAAKYNIYPPDVSRGLPPGIEEFIAKTNQNSEWPEAPWPNSVYDYDRWDNLDGQDTYQISVRFCPVGGPIDDCTFPNEPWAKDFQVNSALYYCIKGNCRAHQSEPVTYPGYCVNCPGNKAIGT